jgi:S-adenosylmethionine/arginine decarboxylase-like enzyme
MPLVHQHIVIRAHVNKPPMSAEEVKNWLKELISKIDMNILNGPHATYLDKEGNRGVTGVCIIETSHIAIHVWDEESPGLIQLDVYSCKDFDKEVVFKHFECFEPVSTEWFMLDRTDKLSITHEIQNG